MKVIIGIRKSAPKGGKLEQFEMLRPGTGNPNVIKNKILRAIEFDSDGNYPGTDEPIYDFYITDGDRKSVSNSFALAGEVVGVIDDKTLIEFNMDENGDVKISKVETTNEEQLPQESTVKQLKRIRKISKGTDIGDKISDMSKQGANIQYIQNPIDKGIESIQDYWRKNKKVFKYPVKRFNQHSKEK